MKTCEVLDLTKNGKIVYSLSLEVLEFQFGKRVSNEKGIEVNIHCTALRNDFIGHKIIMVLQPLQWRCVDCVIHHERDVRKEQKYICVA